MRRGLHVILPLLALVAVAVACGDGDSGDNKSDVSPTAEVTATTEVTVTPDVAETPITEIPPDVTPTVVVTAVPGTQLAIAPQNVQTFLSQFVDTVPTPVDCDYDAETALVDCTEAEAGKFQLSPQAPESVLSCAAGVLDNKVVWIRCITDLSILFYEVAGE